MRRTLLTCLALGVAAGCASTPPADPAPAALLVAPTEAPPVYALLGYREALRLSSEQIAALDSIGQQLSSDNGSLQLRLRELRGDYRGGPVAGRPVRQPEEVREIVQELRENNDRAVAGVRDVLSAEQRTRTCQLFREADQQRARREMVRSAPPPAATRNRRTAARPESMQRPTWTWCAEARRDADAATAPAEARPEAEPPPAPGESPS